MLSQWRQLSQRQGYKERWQWLELSKYGSHAARPSPTRIMARISQQVWPHTEHRLLSQRERTFEGFPFPPAMGGRTKNYAELCRTLQNYGVSLWGWVTLTQTQYNLLQVVKVESGFLSPLLQRPELHMYDRNINTGSKPLFALRLANVSSTTDPGFPLSTSKTGSPNEWSHQCALIWRWALSFQPRILDYLQHF